MGRTKTTSEPSQSRMIWLLLLILISVNVILFPPTCQGFSLPASDVTFGARNLHSRIEDSSSSTSSSSSLRTRSLLFLYQEEGSRGFGEYTTRRDEYLPEELPTSYNNQFGDYYSSDSYRYNNIDDDEFRTLRNHHTSGSTGNNNNNTPTVERINSVLRASRISFRNVEDMTYGLFNDRPFVALLIFVAAGGIVAYMLGFFFLGGYIENWNPVENDSVPYWDEPEIHTIIRVVGK